MEKAVIAETSVERQHAEVQDLPGALTHLWKQIERSDASPLCRSLTTNLIAVAAVAAEAELTQAVQRLLLRHPCRAFLVILDDAAEDVRAELGARVRRQGSGRQTVLEAIALRTPARSFAKIPGLIRPLLVQDLPVHLLWAMPYPENPWALTTLARLADQVIVESRFFGAPIDDLQRLGELPVNTLDLAHFRLRPWRRALAEAFEHFAFDPHTTTRAVITHGLAPGAVAAAYTFSRWLRQRLGTHGDLVAANGQAPEAEPLRLDLEHNGIRVEIAHLTSTPRLRTVITLGDQCLLPFETQASRGQLGDLLAAAVDGI